MNPFDINLFWFGPLVQLLVGGLRLLVAPLEEMMSPGIAAGLAIILFTIIIRLVLLPLSLTQVKSQRAQMAIQPEMKALQKKFKGDREGMARAQMALYKERGVNPASGCLPMLIQMPILFGMYSALLQLSTTGLTLDQITPPQIEPGRIVYAATRLEDPLPTSQFVLTTLRVVPTGNGPIVLHVDQDATQIGHEGASLRATGVQVSDLTLTPGQSVSGVNPPNTPNGEAVLYLRPAGAPKPDGTYDHGASVQPNQPYVVEVAINANNTRVDAARTTVTFDPATASIESVQTPPLHDLAFKSAFFWLPSLGQPDLIHVNGFGIPGLLIILMTITSYVSQRMVTMPTEDPQQQAMMRTMAFMPLMYLFFFLATPAGLVLYWLVSNIFTMIQQYFTAGLGLLAGDLKKLTGRDLQPAWAHVGPPTLSAAPDRNGADEQPDIDDTTPAPAARRPRQAAGKGRKRGKR